MRRHRRARAVSIVADLDREPMLQIPIYGAIAAGLPEAQEEEAIGTVAIGTITSGLTADTPTFALRVRGDSMIGAGIHDGDTVILEQREPRSNDIVSALIDGETTLKTFLREKGQPFLRAENPAYPDLIPARELTIQGVLVALVRKYR
jgi:repressor LexA